MQITDVLRYELIGLRIEVVSASNKNLIGLVGKIVDETKNTLVIESKGITKRLLKNQITMNVRVNNKLYQIHGSALIARPEERLKKKFKK